MKKLFLLALLTLTLAACFNRGNNDSNPSPNAAEPTPDDWQSPDYLFKIWESPWRDSNDVANILNFRPNETGRSKRVYYREKPEEVYNEGFEFTWTATAATITLTVTKVFWGYGHDRFRYMTSTATDKINEIAGGETITLDYTLSPDKNTLQIPAWGRVYRPSIYHFAETRNSQMASRLSFPSRISA